MSYKMLIVEDDELVATAVSLLFKSLGFDRHVISDGAHVLPYLQKATVDIIILDLDLPGTTGDKILAAIRDNPAWRNIPVVPFTAHDDTSSPESLPSKLITANYTRTGIVPEIVFKGGEGSDPAEMNRLLVDEVAYALMNAGRSVTEQMAKWYMQTRGLKVTDLKETG